jgi:ureidoacrylate peracid hydrolase
MPHEVKIPDYVIERIMAKRGKLEVFDRFDPAKTAFLVIDMQNFYVAEVDTAISIVPNINRLAAVCREKGVPVIWVIMKCAEKEGAPSDWPI